MKIEEGKSYRTADGRKVGPMRGDWSLDTEFRFYATSGELSGNLWDENGNLPVYMHPGMHIVSQVADGPIRTETVQKFYPGVYGRISVHSHSPEQGFFTVGFTNLHEHCNDHQYIGPSELREAAGILMDLADFCDGKRGYKNGR